jgi:hypothetical protein
LDSFLNALHSLAKENREDKDRDDAPYNHEGQLPGDNEHEDECNYDENERAHKHGNVC